MLTSIVWPSPERPQQIRARLLQLLAQPAGDVHRGLDYRAPPRVVAWNPTYEDDAVVRYHPQRPQPVTRSTWHNVCFREGWM